MDQHAKRYPGGQVVSRLVWLLAVLCWAASLAAPAQAAHVPEIKVARRDFTELDRAETDGLVPSGSIAVTGVMSSSLLQRPAFPDLYVLAVRPSDRTLCIKFSSADGLYHAEATARLGEHVSATQVRVVLPTRAKRLMKLPGGEVAALVQASPRAACSPENVFLPAAWSTPKATGSVVLLMSGEARSGRPEVRRSDQNQALLCRDLDEVIGGQLHGRKGYRYVCRIQRPERCDRETEYVLARRRSESLPPDGVIRIRGLCAPGAVHE